MMATNDPKYKKRKKVFRLKNKKMRNKSRKANYKKSRPKVRKNRPWSMWDVIMLKNLKESDKWVAEYLDRSVQAIQQKRYMLKNAN